ncbi:MAG: biotin/lipoyl-containing protein, partial [Pseudomonadota bacterium]|nr:biotin/lipoyl-containing protein [Pseudomonadota bacterium]
MATEIRVPALGESVTEATVAKWIRQAGEGVAADEPLVELETDTVTLEVNAPAAGTLAEITITEGATVEVGALLGVIAEGAAPAVTAAATPAAATAAPTATPAPAVEAAPAPAAPPPPAAASAALDKPLSPAVRRLVEEHNLD